MTFHVVPWPTDRQPEEALTSNKARAALIIPADFGRDIARGVNAPVQMLVDGSDSNTAQADLGRYERRLRSAYNAQTASPRPSRCKPRSGSGTTRAARRRNSRTGNFRAGLSMFPPLLASLAMAKEGEQKTILQVYVSSISAHEFLLGKILAFMVVAWRMVHDAGDAVHLFRPEFRGRSDAVSGRDGAVCVLRGVVRTMIGAAIPSQAAAMQAVALGGFLLVFFFRGLIFPVENIPGGTRWISNIVWGRYYIEIVRDALLQGGGWPVHVARRSWRSSVSDWFSMGSRGERMRRMQLRA